MTKPPPTQRPLTHRQKEEVQPIVPTGEQELLHSAWPGGIVGEARHVLRLYRGLKTAYRSEKVPTSTPYPAGTDFTDCPYTAMLYASTPRGVVLVVEVPPTAASRVSEELWMNDSARRLMLWGRFDSFIVRVIPAKELRAELRKRGAPVWTTGPRRRCSQATSTICFGMTLRRP